MSSEIKMPFHTQEPPLEEEEAEGKVRVAKDSLSCGIKFTRVMEELLFLLLTLGLMSGEWSMKGIVKNLTRITEHSSKTIGTSLDKLAALALIDYARDGQGMRVSLNLQHEFIQSLLVRFFGMSSSARPTSSEGVSLESLGFIPDNLDFATALDFLEDYSRELDAQYEEVQSWLDWIAEQERFEAEARQFEKEGDLASSASDVEDLLEVFAESLVSKLEKANENTVNALNRNQVFKIISNALAKKKEELPWEQKYTPGRRKTLKIDY